MKKFLKILVVLLIFGGSTYTQSVQIYSQFKTFQQALTATGLSFSFPKEFKETKALHEGNIDVDYAMELPEENFQVWYSVKNTHQLWLKRKMYEDNLKYSVVPPDSIYNIMATAAAQMLAGKNNYIVKNLTPEVLNTFHADKGKSYQLELFDRPETNHFQYGLLLSLQKTGVGFISILFLSNDNGPDFYKKINKAYYSVKFN
ncbi:MAG: hypothetical protein EOP42_29315 [Sphingobacteriaceae bacterium]|nr:MAG: hypothetical protein EOP42_29315 [Sphingobacteriaceae bacterium]